jgi:GNAT superfamily N-acetyltransferase
MNPQIVYLNIKEFEASALEELFLSVEWSSGQYPARLKRAIGHSDQVFSAWDGEKLVGLVNALDDGEMTAYVHFLLIRPSYQGMGIGKALLDMIKDTYRDYLRIVLISYSEVIPFYERCGFEQSQTGAPMFLTTLLT